jgi:hypothetical protein
MWFWAAKIKAHALNTWNFKIYGCNVQNKNSNYSTRSNNNNKKRGEHLK